jgi:hypothetical protein
MTLARTSTPSHLDYLQLRFLPMPPETAVKIGMKKFIDFYVNAE